VGNQSSRLILLHSGREWPANSKRPIPSRHQARATSPPSSPRHAESRQSQKASSSSTLQQPVSPSSSTPQRSSMIQRGHLASLAPSSTTTPRPLALTRAQPVLVLVHCRSLPHPSPNKQPTNSFSNSGLLAAPPSQTPGSPLTARVVFFNLPPPPP